MAIVYEAVEDIQPSEGSGPVDTYQPRTIREGATTPCSRPTSRTEGLSCFSLLLVWGS